MSGTLVNQGSRNLLVGGDVVAHNPSVLGNFLYRTGSDAPASDFDLGSTGGLHQRHGHRQLHLEQHRFRELLCPSA